VLREACGRREVCDRDPPQSGKNLFAKHERLGSLPLPCEYGPLVCSVLRASRYGSAPAVSGVSLFDSQLCEAKGGGLASSVSALGPVLLPALIAVAVAALAEVSAAVAADRGQRWSGSALRAGLPARRFLPRLHASVRPGQRRCERDRTVGVVARVCATCSAIGAT